MTTIVTAENCSAAQLVEQALIPLETGKTLTLLKDDTTDGLTVRIGSLVFPLTDTAVFTHSQSSLWYFFKAPGGGGSFVRVAFPEEAGIEGSADERVRDAFEAALIDAKLLKTGVEAAGDEFGAGVKEDAQRLASYINSTVKSYMGSHPPTDDPTMFSDGTHKVADHAEAGSGAAAGYAAAAAGAFSKAVIGVGQSIVNAINRVTADPDEDSKLEDDLAEAGYARDGTLEGDRTDASTGPTYETIKPVVDAGKSVASGIAHATSVLTSAIGTGAHNVINHDLGAEAADLSQKGSQTMQNVGSIGKSAVMDPVVIAKKAMSED